MAKRFFYVCGGVLALVAAFALGAVSAKAQTGAAVVGNAVLNGGSPVWTYSVGRQVYFSVNNVAAPQHVATAVPGTDPIAVASSFGGYVTVILANGDVYECTNAPTGGWVLIGNMLSAPTSSQRTSFGQLKARYH